MVDYNQESQRPSILVSAISASEGYQALCITQRQYGDVHYSKPIYANGMVPPPKNKGKGKTMKRGRNLPA